MLAAHVIATMMACACTFLGLMSLRAIVVICAGERVADRLALVLQFVTIVMLVETFLFLPSVLPNIIKAMLQDHASYAWAPPVWFTALFLWIAEGNSVLGGHVFKAVSVTATVTVLVFVVSLLPAAWMGRRVLEVRSRERATGLATLARRIALLWVRGPVVRSLFMFGVSSLVRSRRHTIQLATYFGMAIAVGVLKLLPPLLSLRGSLVLDAPRAYTIAVPLVLMFFAVFGLRAAFTIPTELDANWVFRLVQPTVRESVRASRWLIMMLGVGADFDRVAAVHAGDVAVADGSRRIRARPGDWPASDRTRTQQLDEGPVCQRSRARDRDTQVEGRLVHHRPADVPVHPLRSSNSAPCSRGGRR